MNKTLIFSAIAVVLAAILSFGLYRASQLMTIQLVNTVTINSSRANTYNMVRYFANFPKWSPFLAQDPKQQYSIKGTDGTVGAQYHWVGNEGKDVGYQQLMRLDSNFIGMQCDIQKPFTAKPTFDYTFRETANGIEVTQDFKVQSGLIDAFFMWVFGAKNQMNATNQQGLALLKKAAERL